MTPVKRTPQPIVHESGVRLALRAFGLASVFTIGGVGAASLLVWKASGARTMIDLSDCFRGLFPTSWHRPSRDPTTNFQTFSELWSYILSQDRPPSVECNKNE